MSKNVNAFIRKLAAPQRKKIEARATELIAEEMEEVKKLPTINQLTRTSARLNSFLDSEACEGAQKKRCRG